VPWSDLYAVSVPLRIRSVNPLEPFTGLNWLRRSIEDFGTIFTGYLSTAEKVISSLLADANRVPTDQNTVNIKMPPPSHDRLVPANQPPPLHIPSGSTVSVKIIDSTTSIKMPLSMIMGPHIPGHSDLLCPSYSFLIEHPSGRKVLFDLGTRKDTNNLPPTIISLINSPGCDFNAKKDVAEILEESGIDTGSIEAVVWSHWHCE
jgi:hypothetical protein